MKIIDRKAFLALGHEVLFSKFEPHFFGELQIFNGPIGSNDFQQTTLADALDFGGSSHFVDICESLMKGLPVPVDFSGVGRDGLFDNDQLFAVWERTDVEALISRLKKIAENMPKDGGRV